MVYKRRRPRDHGHYHHGHLRRSPDAENNGCAQRDFVPREDVAINVIAYSH